jgi:carbonic anhydrase
MTFPFIKERVDQGVLSMHGLWTDIGEGGLESYNPTVKEFQAV